jgi:hypothetical protein
MRGFGWLAKVMALCLVLALTPGCQCSAAQIYIPLAYGLTGLCIALLMSPTPLAAVVGFIAGVLLGAAVYNNSLKHQLSARPSPEPHSVIQ